MNARNLFLSVNGRIGRGAFWLGFVVIWAATWALEWAFGIPITDDPATLRLRAIDFAIGLVMTYPTAAVAVKRLRNRDQSVAAVWVLVAALIVIRLGNVTGYCDTAAPMTWFKLFVTVVVAAVVLAFLVELGSGAERFGAATSGDLRMLDAALGSPRPRRSSMRYTALGTILIPAFPSPFITGLIPGWIRWRSGSTLASMVAHSVSNIALTVGTVIAAAMASATP